MSEIDDEIELQLSKHAENLNLWVDRAKKNGWKTQIFTDTFHADSYADTVIISIKKGGIDISLFTIMRNDRFIKAKK